MSGAENSTQNKPAEKGETGGTAHIRYKDGRLSVRVENVPVDLLIEKIAFHAGFGVQQEGQLTRKVSIEFYNLPLWEGLQRVLSKRSFALEFDRHTEHPRNKAQKVPRALWIFNHGEEIEKDLSPDRGRLGDTAEVNFAWVQRAFAEESVAAREEVVAFLGDSGSAAAITPLGLALLDPNAGVREAAVAALSQANHPAAVDMLVFALADPNPKVREEAIDNLGAIGGKRVIPLLRQALSDQHPAVRDAASEWLEEIKGQAPR